MTKVIGVILILGPISGCSYTPDKSGNIGIKLRELGCEFNQVHIQQMKESYSVKVSCK